MAVEIERKFLVTSDDWRWHADGTELEAEVFKQGYIPTAGEQAAVRVRRLSQRALLTIKGPVQGFSRLEYEYEIPVSDAEQMLQHLCAAPLIEKKRYRRQEGELIWEIDVFDGLNLGLVVAEVELASEDVAIDLPH